MQDFSRQLAETVAVGAVYAHRQIANALRRVRVL
jgi:hypothetical protein